MSIDEEFNYYVEYLRNYYSKRLKDNETLTIVGMNDDRGFNIHKNILMNLKDLLESDKYNIELLDMCSMFFNKTRHIDYFLKHNLSLEEIRLMQEYATTKELNHAIGFNVPFMSVASKIFNRLMLTKTPISGDPKDIRISNRIREASSPLIMYASGLNDIMYELHIDPFNLKKSYMARSTDPRYDYACERVNNETINRIVDGHEKNFETLLGLNDDSNIYSLSAYFYSEMKEEYEQKFKEAILMYNEKLQELCSKYGITYVDCRFLENTKYNKPIANYISKYPPQMIAYEIVKSIYENVVNNKHKDRIEVKKFEYDSKGVKGVIEELDKDIKRQDDEYKNSSGYDKLVALEKEEEHERELSVFTQVDNTIQKKRK